MNDFKISFAPSCDASLNSTKIALALVNANLPTTGFTLALINATIPLH